jgi:hypothetical protein
VKALSKVMTKRFRGDLNWKKFLRGAKIHFIKEHFLDYYLEKVENESIFDFSHF